MYVYTYVCSYVSDRAQLAYYVHVSFILCSAQKTLLYTVLCSLLCACKLRLKSECSIRAYYNLVTVLLVYIYQSLLIPYSAKFWRGKTLANLAKRTSFANILRSQIPDSLKWLIYSCKFANVFLAKTLK